MKIRVLPIIFGLLIIVIVLCGCFEESTTSVNEKEKLYGL